MEHQELQSLLYIGAFTDSTPLLDNKIFKNIDRFIYVDGGPQSSYWQKDTTTLGHYKAQNFEECLKISIETSGREILSFDKSCENTYHIKLENGKEIYYFYNTIFPHKLTKRMSTMVKECQYVMYTGMPVTKDIYAYIKKECKKLHTQYVGYLEDNELYKLNLNVIPYNSMWNQNILPVDFPDFNKQTKQLLKTSKYTMKNPTKNVKRQLKLTFKNAKK